MNKQSFVGDHCAEDDASWSESCSDGEDFSKKLKDGGLLGDDSDSDCEEVFADAAPACPPANMKKPAPCGDELRPAQQQIGAAVPQQVAAPSAAAAAATAADEAPLSAEAAKALATKKFNKKSRAMHVADAKAQEEYSRNRVTNRYWVAKVFTLHGLAKGADGMKPEWKVEEAAHFVFKKEKNDSGLKSKENSERIGDLQKAVIERAVLRFGMNDGPVDIGVKIPGIKTGLVDEHGNEYAFVLASGEMSRGEFEVYNNQSVMNNKYMQKYGNLTKEQVRATYSDHFGTHKNVIVSSPIVSVMNMSPKWRSTLHSAPVVDHKMAGKMPYVELPSEIVADVQKTMDEMLDALPHVDMTEYKNEFFRMDSPNDWADIRGIVDSNPQEELKRRFVVKYELEVTHVLTTI